MNIFVVDTCPIKSAQMLPDKHVVKMSLEACQMISIIYSSWYFNWGTIPKADGTAYSTKKGIFKNHPCTIWAGKNHENLAWLIIHGKALCDEYLYRYGKVHACSIPLQQAEFMFFEKTGLRLDVYKNVTQFVRVMTDEFKNDQSIDTITAYQRYVVSKPWVRSNYSRKPERKPLWIG
ncbi:MAG: pyrimidine dimer DNA glycosylase/endonuclease V [Candidatus Chromulinivorax sp.]|nr:pyrimidine dimer DNA glycosylase/endonuclease V [Candidatus Chromulinivorax sp.]